MGTVNDGRRFIPDPHGRDDRGWIATVTGRCFWPMQPRADEVFLEDIAHHLGMLCRFNGACLNFYSVAEHSWLIWDHLRQNGASRNVRRWALLHDAPEAYMADVTRPVKRNLPDYSLAEDRLMRCIQERFGLTYGPPEEVVAADNAIINDERERLMKPTGFSWSSDGNPLGVDVKCWLPHEASTRFLMACHDEYLA